MRTRYMLSMTCVIDDIRRFRRFWGGEARDDDGLPHGRSAESDRQEKEDEMRLRSLLATSVLAIGLSIGQAAMAATTVTFWQFFTGDADVAAWRSAIAKFETANPDIKINMELVPWSEQQQRFVTALATGGLPDVSMLGNNVVAQFQATGSLAPLDEYVAAYDAEHGTKIADEIWPGDKGYYILDGKLWASPIAVETRALYYRKDLFKEAGLDPEKAPQTWEELATAAAALSKA